MSKHLDAVFVVFGLVLVLGGMILGAVMGSSGDHGQQPTHAHINLVGGVFSILFGLAYRGWPALRAGLLPGIHLLLHVVGVLVMTAGLALMYGGAGETPLTIALASGGSGAVMLGTLIFLFLFATKAFRIPG
jgi:peptidoglycan/LPS O-acetylase OafA/YrhL